MINQSIYDYLSKCNSCDIVEIDKLFVTSFVYINKIELCKNQFIQSYLLERDSEILVDFIDLIENTSKCFELEDLIELYEFVISPADKIINGAVYTPSNIRKFIVYKAFEEVTIEIYNLRTADISCGCGGFLYTMSQKIKSLTNNSYQYIFENNIFGLDIQPYAINRTKIILTLLALMEGEDLSEFKFNLFVGDALSFDFNKVVSEFRGFDMIVGNPPYVCSRHLTQETKTKLQSWHVCKTGHPDLYIPFFQIAVENLKERGFLGFITMNTFFKSLNARALRGYFEELSYDFKIIDFGCEQVFKSKSTYTCICLITKVQSDNLSFIRLNSSTLSYEAPINYSNIMYRDLDSIKGWNLQDFNIMSKIESTGIPLGQLYKSRHGIATLKNKIYIFRPSSEDELYFYLNFENRIFPIEKGICRDIINSNKLSGDVNIKDIVEKVIFPYTDMDSPRPIDEIYFKSVFPNAYKYLEYFKNILAKRDKGGGKYEKWFCFGRTQSLEKMKYKLFFPKISNKPPRSLICTDEKMMFYNGQAIIGNNRKELLFIKKIMESKLFWYYIKTSSKPYSSNYYSLNGNYIKNFGIFQFSDEEKDYIIHESNMNILDHYLENKYQIKVP